MARTTAVYYSATGNSLALAKRVKDAELLSIDALINGEATIAEDTDRLGIFFPVYGSGLPLPVRIFVREVLAKRDNSALGYIFAVATCGLSGRSAEWMIDRELQDIGLNISYTASVKLPDGYLPLLKKVPDEEDTRRIFAEAELKVQRILGDTEKEEFHLPHRPPFGLFLKKFSEKFNSLHEKPKKLEISGDCVGCTTCAKVCPTDNIDIKNGKAEIGDRCIQCYACYHRCPKAAIHFGSLTGQYKGVVETKELYRR